MLASWGRRGYRLGITVGATLLMTIPQACDRPIDAPEVIVGGTRSSNQGCMVKNAIGRYAYTPDPKQCTTGKRANFNFASQPNLFGLVTWNDWDQTDWSIYNGAADLGASMVRMHISWSMVERWPGDRNAEYIALIHDMVDRFGVRGVKVYLDINGVPAWAQDCNNKWSPAQECPAAIEGPPDYSHMDAWAAITDFIVQEYGSPHGQQYLVNYYGFGNEPNTMFMHGVTRTLRIAKYAQMMQILAGSVHALGSFYKVVGPEIAWNTSDDQEINGPAWFGEYMQQAGSVTDVISAHSYRGVSWWARHAEGRGRGYGVFTAMQEVASQPGVNGRPLWATEIGRGAGDGDDASSEGAQGQFIVSAYSYFLTDAIPGLERVFAFAQFSGPPEEYFGLMRINPDHSVYKKYQYLCYKQMAKLHQIPYWIMPCQAPDVNITQGPPETISTVTQPYAYIQGTRDINNGETAYVTTYLSNGVTPTTCDWWVDGVYMETSGCGYSRSFSDGPTIHTITAIAYDATDTDYPSADFSLNVHNYGDCDPQVEQCWDMRRGKRLSSPAKPSGKPARNGQSLISKMMGTP